MSKDPSDYAVTVAQLARRMGASKKAMKRLIRRLDMKVDRLGDEARGRMVLTAGQAAELIEKRKEGLEKAGRRTRKKIKSITDVVRAFFS